MNLYSIDINICATAYIKAETETKAREIAQLHFSNLSGGNLPVDETAHIPVSQKAYVDPTLPDVSLSPAVTFYGPSEGLWRMDLVDENFLPVDTSEPKPDYEALCREKGWKARNGNGFIFHEPTWGCWKEAVCWEGTTYEPSGPDARPRTYGTWRQCYKNEVLEP